LVAAYNSGIGGLEDCILKSAALSSTVACPAFTDVHHEATAIVRVAVEPRAMSKFYYFVKCAKFPRYICNLIFAVLMANATKVGLTN